MKALPPALSMTVLGKSAMVSQNNKKPPKGGFRK
jgi:hypothetical protein